MERKDLILYKKILKDKRDTYKQYLKNSKLAEEYMDMLEEKYGYLAFGWPSSSQSSGLIPAPSLPSSSTNQTQTFFAGGGRSQTFTTTSTGFAEFGMFVLVSTALPIQFNISAVSSGYDFAIGFQTNSYTSAATLPGDGTSGDVTGVAQRSPAYIMLEFNQTTNGILINKQTTSAAPFTGDTSHSEFRTGLSIPLSAQLNLAFGFPTLNSFNIYLNGTLANTISNSGFASVYGATLFLKQGSISISLT